MPCLLQPTQFLRHGFRDLAIIRRCPSHFSRVMIRRKRICQRLNCLRDVATAPPWCQAQGHRQAPTCRQILGQTQLWATVLCLGNNGVTLPTVTACLLWVKVLTCRTMWQRTEARPEQPQVVPSALQRLAVSGSLTNVLMLQHVKAAAESTGIAVQGLLGWAAADCFAQPSRPCPSALEAPRLS